MAQESARGRGWAVAATFAVAAFVLYLLRNVLLPFLLAAALAFVARPWMEWAHERWRVPRWLSGIVVLLFFVAGVVGFGYWIGSLVVTEVPHLASRLPDVVHGLVTRFLGDRTLELMGQSWNADQITAKVIDTIKSSIAPAQALRWAAGGMALAFAGVLTIVLAAFFLASGPRLARGALWLVPPSYRGVVHELACRIAPILRRYIVGVVLVVAYTAFVAWIGFGPIFGLPHAPLLAVTVGVLEMIPVVGPVVSAALVAANVVQQTSVWAIVGLIAFAVALRISIDELVGPFVLGRAASVHPVVVIFAFLAGATLYGIFGLILAVPTAAAIKIGLNYWYEERERQAQGGP